MAKSNRTKTIMNAIVIVVIAAVPIGIVLLPNLLRIRIRQLESAQNASIRNVIISAITYKTTHCRYPHDLKELGDEGLIDSQLASGEKAGYIFSLRSTSDNFFVIASPAQVGDFTQSLCADQSGILHHEPGQECTLQSPILK